MAYQYEFICTKCGSKGKFPSIYSKQELKEKPQLIYVCRFCRGLSRINGALFVSQMQDKNMNLSKF